MPTFQVDKNRADNMKKSFKKVLRTFSLRTKGSLLHMTGISCARDERLTYRALGASHSLIPTYRKRAKK